MTTGAQIVDAEEAKKEAVKARNANLEAKEVEANKSVSGKGLRTRFGMTRGKNPKEISWKAFDTDKPETLPENQQEFVDLSGTSTEGQLLAYLIDGFNASQYAAASDVLSEYVEPNWPDSLVAAFKKAVTGYVTAMAGAVGIEEAVALMKPGIQKAFEAKLAAAKA